MVDVSNNRRVNQYPESNAEYLASLLPDSVVVKAFNVISAWAMQQPCPRDACVQVQHGANGKLQPCTLSDLLPLSRCWSAVTQLMLGSRSWN